MNRAEWSEIAGIMTANWPHQVIPDASLAKFYEDLRDLPAEQVHAGVEAVYRSGAAFPPNGAQIRRQIIDLNLDLPTWGEVWNQIMHAVGKFGTWNEDKAQDELGVFHPLALQLVREVGFRSICLCEDPLTVLEAQCRRKWEQMTARVERDGMLTGLPSGGLRTLERVNGGPRLLAEAMEEVFEGKPEGRTHDEAA